MNDENDRFSFRNTYTMINVGGGLVLTAENEEEKKHLDAIEKTIQTKVARLSKDHVGIKNIGEEQRDTLKLKKLLDEFLEFKEKTQEQKVFIKYKQVAEYLLIFFGDKHLVQSITRKDANDFRNFLMEVPKFWKNQADLKDKNLKLMIDKKSKLLDRYEKQAPRTVDEILKRTKSIFEHFMDNLYINNNPFENLKKIDNNKTHAISWRAFSEGELAPLFWNLKRNNLHEEHDYLKFMLMTGVRRGESLKLKVEDINLEDGYINVKGTKTENALRIVPIHKDLMEVIEKQLNSKNSEDFLFFHSKKLALRYREEKIGAMINGLISENVKEEIKKELNIHSLRKNFAQELFLSDLFQDIDLKTIIGHSTKGSTTAKHYLMGKRDYPKYIEKINQIDFKKYYNGYQDKLIKRTTLELSI